MRMTVGGLEAKLKRAVSLPSSAMSSSRTILTTCSEGESAVSTSTADGFLADVLDEVVDDFEVYVGVEQGHANLAESFGDVLFSKRALAAKAFEDTLQFVCKVFKHGRSS